MAGKKLWGGRFSGATDQLVEQYTESVSYDRALWQADIQGSKAHAAMLAARGVLRPEEAAAIRAGLDEIAAEIEAGTFAFLAEREDVHMNIEARLTEKIGPLGGKLHTARSRNDQVALDFRLYVDASLVQWQRRIAHCIAVLAGRARDHVDTLLPGTTHLQPAQPVSLAQHLLAYAWMLRRDYDRMADARKRVRVSPLGAAALAGTTYDIAPAVVAREVGFEEVFPNSMDAVSDRDFVVESLACASLVMAHLSRLCEELILWANPMFGFVSLPDGFATGSSIMPQKKNPDVCELMRGKTGRVYGSLTALLTILKGLPLTYNRDLQEDKEPFFDADRTVRDSLEIMAALLEKLGFRTEAMRAALDRGFLNATELADYLAAKGMPFREAHGVAGRAVALAESRGLGLADLSLEDYRTLSGRIDDDVYAVLDYEAAVRRRVSPGSTGPQSVRVQLEALQMWLTSGAMAGGRETEP